jgi:hypothetical protein
MKDRFYAFGRLWIGGSWLLILAEALGLVVSYALTFAVIGAVFVFIHWALTDLPRMSDKEMAREMAQRPEVVEWCRRVYGATKDLP